MIPKFHICQKNAEKLPLSGLKFTLTNENVGAQAVEKLKQVKDDPQIFKEYLVEGLDVCFRHEGLNLWVNVTVPETFPELQGNPIWDKLDLSKETFSGRVDWKVTSGADPIKFVTDKFLNISNTFDDILEKACKFSVQ